jgi:hypothetical protein
MGQDVVYSNTRELLRRLKNIDPALRKALIRDLKKVSKPVQTAIQNAIPAEAPLRGMNNNGRLSWNNSTNKNGQRINARKTALRFRAGSKKPGITSLVSVQALSPALAMVDTARRAKTRQGAVMIRALAMRPSRYVWPAAEKALPEAQHESQLILNKAAAQISRSF